MNRVKSLLLSVVLAAATPWVNGAELSVAPADHHAEQDRMLVEGRKVFESGRRQDAIDGYYDKVIEYFRSTYATPGKKVYCARTFQEGILYAALAGTGQETLGGTEQETLVLGPTWAEAYLMKAYALVELGEVEQAHAALDAALALSPQSSQYLAELGYLYQAERNWEKSLEVYQSSAEAAGLTSPDGLKKSDLARAYRGQGYALTELGRFDDAEALYKKCLKLDRRDQKARNELKYIRTLRANGPAPR